MPGRMRWDETWRRLRDWTDASGKAERLAAQLLYDAGFENVDPSHPLGGPDGTKDAVASRDGKRWIMAVYFPRGEESFAKIKKKFGQDYPGVAKAGAAGIAFVTNQELRLAERVKLEEIGEADGVDVDLFHLERITTMLDRPQLHGVRSQFLDIPVPQPEQVPADSRLATAAHEWARLAKLDEWDDWTPRLMGGRTAALRHNRFLELEAVHDYVIRLVLPEEPVRTVDGFRTFTRLLGDFRELLHEHGDAVEADPDDIRVAPPQRQHQKAYQIYLDALAEIQKTVWSMTAAANELMDGVRGDGVDPDFCKDIGWLRGGFEQPPRWPGDLRQLLGRVQSPNDEPPAR